MKIEINPKLKPLYANLLRQGIGKYLISTEFNHFNIENNLDQIWDTCYEYVHSLRSYTVLAPDYTGYAEDALGVFLCELSKVEKITFIEILGKILINFAVWSHESIDFSKIKKDIIDLGYNEDEIEKILSQISNKKEKKFSIQNALARIVTLLKKRKVKRSINNERAWYKDLKIIIPGVVVPILIFFGYLISPYIYDNLLGEHPDTYICVIGMDNSYAYFPANNYEVTLKPIKFPNGISNFEKLWIPHEMFNWTHSENAKYYLVTAHNMGDGTAKNIKIKINFEYLNSINSVKVLHEDRVKIIEGGIKGSYIVFRIPELLPDEKQIIKILINHKNLGTIKVWSETEGDLKNIYIFDMVVEQYSNSNTSNSGTIMVKFS